MLSVPIDDARILRYAAALLRKGSMGQLTRRNVLQGALASPALLKAAFGTAPEAGTDKPKRFEEVVGFELAEVVATHPLAILPLGSLEFHGPHNPLGTDSIIISGIAERVAARTRALLFPAVTFTQCPAHTSHFQGTISVRPEVMTLYFEDILRNILHLGFRKVFILNGHDGNIGPARGAVARIADEIQDAALLFANWWEFVSRQTMQTM